MFRIPEESKKGNEDRILPVAPEFAIWLKQIPAHKRSGHAFNPGHRTKTRAV